MRVIERSTRSLLAVVLATTLLAAGLDAQAPRGGEAGSELRVYLMTMGEGDLVWERFGHNAIWIHDPVAGTDHTYHWGLFDFDEPGFLRRFIQGRMFYSMGAADVQAMTRAYVRANRSVWVQELELTPRQRLELAEFVEWNIRPENRFYHYDYYYDNCSTRVRDALDRALGGEIRRQTERVGAGESFRSHTRRLTTNDVATYTGLMAGLGQGVDGEITLWEEMFLPLAMMETVRDLTVDDGQGGRIPMVRSEQTAFLADRPTLPESPPRWWPYYLLVGVAVAGAILGLGHIAEQSAVARAGLVGLGTVWGLVAGLLGVVLAGLWLFTDHAAAYRNENLFLFNPLALGLVVLVPALVYGPRLIRGAVWLTAVLAALSLLGTLLKPLPWLYQVNGELIALALPINVALALVAFLTARRTPPPPGEYQPRSAAGRAN